MPQHEEKTPQGKEQSDHVKPTLNSTRPSSKPWFETPAPIKRLFDKFPLQTYPPNELPQRTSVDRTRNTLHVFTTDEAAHRGAPSFNPSCLKWQVCSRCLRNLGSKTTSANPIVLGVSQIQGSRVCHSRFEQPCCTHWSSPLPPTIWSLTPI